MAWPSMVESFLVALVGFIDTIMVSTLGSYAIAAVGLTQQPKFIGLALFMSMSTAISRWLHCVGASRTAKARCAF